MKTAKFIGRRENMSTFQVGPHYVHVSNKPALLKMLNSKRAAAVFYVSETYSQTTPESAEYGDYSECGYENYGQFYTLKELLKELNGRCYHDNGNGSFYDSDSRTICYRTGTEQQNCLHVTASAQNMERLNRALQIENK